MFKPGFELATDDHLSAAAFNKQTVSVWYQGSVVDAGIIENISDTAVRINEKWYTKEFKLSKEFAVRAHNFRIR